MANPIWKDYIVDMGTASSVYFRVILSSTNTVIYSGRAHKRPGEANIYVRINDICADWFTNVLPTMGLTEFTKMPIPVSFIIKTSADQLTWSTVDTVAFLPDWSYDYGYDAATMGLSFPVNGHIDLRQPMVFSDINISEVPVTVHLKDGSSYNVIIPVEKMDDYNNDYNDDYSQDDADPDTGTAVFNVSEYPDVDYVTMGTLTYKVVTQCARYALYYINAYGGWDTLLIEGNATERDTLTRHTRMGAYDNSLNVNRGKWNNVNEVVKSYDLWTADMKDEEAARMHHLINATEVYLYDIASGTMTPVIVTDTECVYKTRRNQGNHMVQYSVTVEVAQTRIRR